MWLVLCCVVWVLVPFYLLNIIMRSSPVFSRKKNPSTVFVTVHTMCAYMQEVMSMLISMLNIELKLWFTKHMSNTHRHTIQRGK